MLLNLWYTAWLESAEAAGEHLPRFQLQNRVAVV
jgi:hypothetical protein